MKFILISCQIIDRIDGVAKRYMDAKRLARRYADERKDQHSERERRHAKDYLKRYHSMIARVGITVAHEMEHVFTGYLLKDPKTHTPPPVTYGGFGTYAFGESGRYMEGDVFGGFLDMKYELSSDMEVNAVRTYSQTFILSYDQVNAIIKRRKSRLPFHRTDCLVLFSNIACYFRSHHRRASHLLYGTQSGIFCQPTTPKETATEVHHRSLRQRRLI